MNLRIRHLLFALLGLGSLVSCTKEMETLDLEASQKMLIVEASFTNILKEHEVKLTRSAGYLTEEDIPFVTNATVTITDDAGNTFPLTYDKDGVYKTQQVQGEIGRTYTLNVAVDGTTYTASETMKRVPPIDSLYYQSQKGSDIDQSGRPGTKTYDKDKYRTRFLIFTTEPDGTGDYYYWSIEKNDTLITDTLGQTLFVDDQFVDGSDYLVFEYDERAEFNPVYGLPGDTITITTHAVTKKYYDYIFGVLLETDFSGSPFGGAPANIATNLSDGAQGYFSVEACAPYKFELQFIFDNWLPSTPIE